MVATKVRTYFILEYTQQLYYRVRTRMQRYALFEFNQSRCILNNKL